MTLPGAIMPAPVTWPAANHGHNGDPPQRLTTDTACLLIPQRCRKDFIRDTGSNRKTLLAHGGDIYLGVVDGAQRTAQ